MAITVEMREQVSQLYVALFGRAPDGEGLGFWVQQLNSGKTLAQVADAMYATAPARDYYPSFLTNGEIVASFYVNVLGREADAEGLAFWTGKLNAAGATPGSVITEMINVVANYGGTNEAGLQSAALFNNKVVVAQYYGEQNGTIEGATTVLTGVTADPATVDETIADIDNGTIGGVQQGETFVLTVDPDNITGTNGNDTIVVPYSNALGDTVTTWQAFDKVNGGDGDDTINIYVKDGANSSQAGTIDGVEMVNIYNSEASSVFGSSGGINAAKFAGAKEIWQIEGNTDIFNVGATTVVGFRGDVNASANIDVASGNSTLNIALDMVNVDSSVWLDIGEDTGGVSSLNTINITGTYSETNSKGKVVPAEIDLDIWAGTGTKLTLNSAVDADLWISPGKAGVFSELDGSASTGGLNVEATNGLLQTVTTGGGDDVIGDTYFVATASKAATYSTGAGDDEIDVLTDGAGTTTVNAGDGDDSMFVSDASKTLVVNGGAGDDSLTFYSGFQTSGFLGSSGGTSTSKITGDMGAGDDNVEFENLIMADLPAAWVIDGGADTDSVTLDAGVGRTFVAGDYITLTESLKNFEALDLLAGEDQDFTVDASRLANYKAITFIGDSGNDIVVTKAAADQTIGIDNDGGGSMTLTVSSVGYTAAVVGPPAVAAVYGGDLLLDVNVWDGQSLGVIANGNNVTMTLGVGSDTPHTLGQTGAVYVGGDYKTLSVAMNAQTITDSTTKLAIGVEEVTLNVENGQAAAATTLTLTGTGDAVVDRAHGDKMATIDASGLTAISWDSTNAVVKTTGLGLDYGTTNDGVAETIKLGTGYDDLFFGFYDNAAADRWASSYAKMDKVENFTMVATSADVATIDSAKSDLIFVDDSLVGGATFEKLGTSAAATVSGAASFGLALQAVAQNATQNYVVFQYGGNTYVYGDTGGLTGADLVTTANDQLDDTDLVIQLTGTVNLDLLLQSLNQTYI